MPENEMMETGADGIAGKLQVRLVEEGHAVRLRGRTYRSPMKAARTVR